MFIHSCIQSLIHSLIHSLTHSFIHSFVRFSHGHRGQPGPTDHTAHMCIAVTHAGLVRLRQV